MKWNFICAFVTLLSVYAAVALPLYYKLRDAPPLPTSTVIQPVAAFVVAVPFALCSALAVFVVCYLLQRYGVKL